MLVSGKLVFGLIMVDLLFVVVVFGYFGALDMDNYVVGHWVYYTPANSPVDGVHCVCWYYSGDVSQYLNDSRYRVVPVFG